jgi:asparagine synthase (glutamine-hydrolysing)
MNDRLIHRGPDDSGVSCNGPAGLGQRRLAIIDLSPEGTAPLPNEDKTVWVTFNGEIYNYRSLRSGLERKGHRFRTKTDTEVIVHLYEEHGTDCLAHLRGMYAIAIWDSSRHRLFAARDRLGQKPFFYAHSSSGLLFASEIKALLPEQEVPRRPNLSALDAYLTYQYVPSPVTAFEGIKKLPPAHFLSCELDGTLEIKRYWSPPASTPTTDTSGESLYTAIRSQIREAVELRMVSDVPIGALLSGGIDSGTTVAMMAAASDRPVETFTLGLKGFSSMNEMPLARKVAERYGTNHHELVIEPEATEILPWLVRHYDEPFADSSALPTYYISKLAREHVTVALAGDGGDESFAGYGRYGRMQRWSAVDIIPQPMRRTFVGGLERAARMLPTAHWTTKLQKGLQMIASSTRGRYRLYRSIFKPQDKRHAYGERFIQAKKSRTGFETAVSYDGDEPLLQWMMRNDQQNYLAECLNTKVDMASMANSLEIRAPFQDHKLVEFAASIPAEKKWTHGQSKSLLREAVRPLLPDEIIDKPKSGFSIPIGQWFRTDLKPLLFETLLDHRAASRDLLRPDFVQHLVNDHLSGKRDCTWQLWPLVCMELWFRAYID